MRKDILNRHLRWVLSFAFMLVCVPSVLSAQDDVSILVQNDTHLEFSYNPEIVLEKQSHDGNETTQIIFSKMIRDGKPGEPVVPYRSFVFAVPASSEPRVTITSSEYHTLNEVTLETAPAGVKIADFKPEDKWFGASVLSSVETGFFRQQKIIRFNLHPVQYNEYSKHARIADKITVRIEYQNSREAAGIPTSVSADRKSEHLYRSLLGNYEPARTWRKDLERSSGLQKSSFSSGYWYKFPVTEEGMYLITYSDLQSSGINPADIDPETIKIFNNGGTMLPDEMSEERPDGLIENSIIVVGGEDNSFDSGDYVLFYGRGRESWYLNEQNNQIEHTFNVYSNSNTYWFTYGGQAGKRMETEPYQSGSVVRHTTGRGYYVLEQDSVKMFDSGSDMYLAEIDKGASRYYRFRLPGKVSGSPVDFRFRILTSTPYPYVPISQYFLGVWINDADVDSLFIHPAITYIVVDHTLDLPDIDEHSLKFENYSPFSQSHLYLDWFEFEYHLRLALDNGILKFQPALATGPSEFIVRNAPDSNFDVFDITDFSSVIRLETRFSAGDSTLTFSDFLSPENRQYLVLDRDLYRTIPEMEPVANSFLKSSQRAADMLIIAPQEFAGPAQRLEQFHESNNGIMTEVVLLHEIYNEFGAGIADPVAIRDFVKHAYENWTTGGNPPRYLLLFGDGNYDYTGVFPNSEPNRIPPYAINSTVALVSRAVDDFYACVSGDDNFVDMAVGRLPVKSSSMADDMVTKIINYFENPEYGPWRSTITFVADDEHTNYSDIEDIHTDDTERLSNAPYVQGFLEQKKIYLMEYPGVPNVSARTDKKPEAADAFVGRMNTGSRIITYVGHGNHRLLAHEEVLNREADMPRIDNGNRQFFFYIASCGFGRWDLPDEDSMAELLLTAPDRGAIGIISASRDVFARANVELADEFFNHLYNDTRTTETVGEALQVGKILVNGANSEKYQLLGDPTFRFEFPRDIINEVAIDKDSLKAMATINVTGNISSGSAFDGSVFLSVFDSEKLGSHVMVNGEVKNYKLPGSGIFRGSDEVTGSDAGRIDMKFIVPRDITYGGLNGRIGLYVWDENGDGTAYIDNIPVGGTETGVTDFDGPEIEMFLNDRHFMSGDMVQPNTNLKINLSDPQGINITGEVGHKIELSFNNDSRVVDLSNHFTYNTGSYTEGSINYNLTDLQSGENTFYVRAWDNFNNSSRYNGIFRVMAGEELFVDQVVNYPNPFAEETQFTCQVSMPAEIEIRIYTVAGRLVKTLDPMDANNSSFFVSPVWDGTDDDGDRMANGTYLYKLIARSYSTGELQQIEKIGKLVIMR